MILRRISETDVDLPTPVEPTTAKCRVSSLSRSSWAGMLLILRELPTVMRAVGARLVHQFKIGGAHPVRDRAHLRIVGDAGREAGPPSITLGDFADQFDMNTDTVVRRHRPSWPQFSTLKHWPTTRLRPSRSVRSADSPVIFLGRVCRIDFGADDGIHAIAIDYVSRASVGVPAIRSVPAYRPHPAATELTAP